MKMITTFMSNLSGSIVFNGIGTTFIIAGLEIIKWYHDNKDDM